MIGTKFSHYTIVDKIGEGGMGEVYRAEDANLKRQVAVKVLPSHLLDDAERLARFEREAQLLASLNHPNIAAVHGLEVAEGNRCLVMEYVEGDNLAVLLERGALDPDTVLSVARQVAAALEFAHEKGIIHRDLKPANVILRPDGTVKVLDFGLAKAIEGDPTESNPHVSQSPTLTGMMTGANVILGTAAYMSPEQARGQVVDKRTDIWAYGVVLYELLTGRQAFPGDTVSDILASVIKSDPDFDALPESTPPALLQVVRRCLVKDPQTRLRDMGEARLLLDPTTSGLVLPSTFVAEEPAPVRRSSPLPWILVAVFALVAAAGWLLRPAPEPVTLRASALVPADHRLMTWGGGHLAFSPDGSSIAFAAVDTNGVANLWVRNLSDAEPHRLSGTEGAINPFWAPDGERIGYFDDERLRVIPVAGGAPTTLCEAGSGRGGYWDEDDVIVYTPTFGGDLLSIPAAGGEPSVVLERGPNEISLRWPWRLPGDGLLFTRHAEDVGVAFLASGDSARMLVPSATQAEYHDGLLYYVVDGVLFARAFDPGSGEFTAPPRTVVTDVFQSTNFGRGAFSVSGRGDVAYILESSDQIVRRDMVQVGLDGTRLGTWTFEGGPSDPALSPDGTRMAVSMSDPAASGFDVWILDAARNVRTRFTFTGTADDPVWSPDGARLAYAENGGVRIRRANGVGETQEITDGGVDDCMHDWSPDGRHLLWSRGGAQGLRLWVHDLESGESRPLIENRDAMQGRFSPDGRWLAYVSDASGRNEIYVQDFPGLQGLWQVSGDGGVFPQWGPDGATLVYMNGNRSAVRVPVEPTGDDLRFGRPETLFPLDLNEDRSIRMALAPDGQSLWFVQQPDRRGSGRRDAVQFILNWQAGG